MNTLLIVVFGFIKVPSIKTHFLFVNPKEDYRRIWEVCEQYGNKTIDTNNASLVGNWPFGPSYAVSYDNSRNTAFLSSGGGVYIIDVSNPANPVKFPRKIHTRDIVYGIFYDNNKALPCVL